ncbi:MAG: ribonuclease P protein component [Nocardioidaceae bacterium]|nr:ribonuclease P protein component [Nocardioidaceae bacterium]
MLPPAVRMRDGREFGTTRRRGRRAGTTSLVVHLNVVDVTDLDVPSREVGVVTGKSVGPAVTRNRVKRRLRHLVADRLDTLPMGTRLVVRALPPSATRSFDDLGRDLDRAIDKATRTGARA